MVRASTALIALLLLMASVAHGALNYECLRCHGYAGFQIGSQELWVPEASYDTMGKHHQRYRLWVGQSAFDVSQHRKLACTDCHKGDLTWPHDIGLEVRCDLACHAPGKDHKAVVETERGSAHAGAVDSKGLGMSCLFCHDGAPAPRGSDAQAQCLSCHSEVERERASFPDTPGAFGDRAHRRAADWANVPACVDCHGNHGIKSGEQARASCANGGCHEGSDEAFSQLFDHGSPVDDEAGKRKGSLLWLSVAGVVGLLGFLHSVKG